MAESNFLREYFFKNEGKLIFKWHHYFEIYDRYFHRYRDQEVVILEIGVYHGGSLQMWKSYFGNKAKIYGIDINPECKALEEENITIFIGSQEDRKFLREVKSKMPPCDILLDDGGHSMKQQIVSFEELFDHIKPDGIYMCEDTHTSYWSKWQGGHRRPGTFIEYTKNFIDYIHAWHSKTKRLVVNAFTRSVFAVHFYDSIVVLEKKKIDPPIATMTGKRTIKEMKVPKKSLLRRIFPSD